MKFLTALLLITILSLPTTLYAQETTLTSAEQEKVDQARAGNNSSVDLLRRLLQFSPTIQLLRLPGRLIEGYRYNRATDRKQNLEQKREQHRQYWADNPPTPAAPKSGSSQTSDTPSSGGKSGSKPSGVPGSDGGGSGGGGIIKKPLPDNDDDKKPKKKTGSAVITAFDDWFEWFLR